MGKALIYKVEANFIVCLTLRFVYSQAKRESDWNLVAFKAKGKSRLFSVMVFLGIKIGAVALTDGAFINSLKSRVTINFVPLQCPLRTTKFRLRITGTPRFNSSVWGEARPL